MDVTEQIEGRTIREYKGVVNKTRSLTYEGTPWV